MCEIVFKEERQVTCLKNVSLFGKTTDIVIKDGKILAIGKTEANGVDMHGLRIYPGLIDIHCHGCVGCDTMDKEDNLGKMSEFLAQNGTTAWYPTTMTMSAEDIIAATNKPIKSSCGAQILGFHMEGPFINPKYKGAQSEDFILNPSMELFEKCNNVKIVTLAPEMEGSLEFIKSCPAILSLGHSDADYNTAMGAIASGVRCLTHTFNAMPPIHHRAPGPILAAAESEDVYAQVIADGIHIHPAVLRMTAKLVGKDRMILISDSMRAAGMPDGEYDLGGQTMRVEGGRALTKDGHLAGSVATLFDCVRFVISIGFDAEDAVRMASENPARLMGLNKGKIEAGYDADFIFVDDSFNLVGTMINGIFANNNLQKED